MVRLNTVGEGGVIFPRSATSDVLMTGACVYEFTGDALLPKGVRLYNIFHPLDPVVGFEFFLSRAVVGF